MDENGSVPTLAVFMIFVLICSWAAVSTFESREERMTTLIYKTTAADIARATLSSIESELNEILETSITAAMQEIGEKGGERNSGDNLQKIILQKIEDNVYKDLDNRISKGWKYTNLMIEVPAENDNYLELMWMPDGSLVATGYIDAKVEHVMGASAYGVKLFAAPHPRFLRLTKIAELISENETIEELNDNFKCEGVYIERMGGQIIIYDNFGGRCVLL
jgi:hypothetical protein